ncbi:MAG TPA: alpha-glucuronidase family glycosyl hydrolase [Humisphaera sp.]|nr:alpha-glucuronidase family glycosyl hydrolase [Humisphaera sp.]
MNHKSPSRFVGLFLVLSGAISIARAETGYDGWLRYAPIDDPAARKSYDMLPAVVVTSEDSPIIRSAREELVRGVRGMLGRTLRISSSPPDEPCIILGGIDAIRTSLPAIGELPKILPDGFLLKTIDTGDKHYLLIAGGDDRGVLYGTFEFLRMIAQQQPISNLNIQETPYAPIRFLNHWDNLNGTIERGYAGRSIFWDNDHITTDLDRVRDYARLMASVGINGCSINNVNADPRVVSAEFLPQIAKVADVFRPWGVRMMVSLDFASPRRIGGIDTFDPLDPRAVEFWKKTIDQLYAAIPDLAGCVLKADSEGRLGPSDYGRTHADAANVIARALKPHGGVLFYRGFVYNNKMDWRDLSVDRAKAAYDNFHKLDGKFDDNVIVQIKHGPIDFQVREPASPLFGGLEQTNEAIELQITQEYLGQQRHVCFLPPMWKQTLDFDMRAKGDGTPVKAIVAGKTFGRPTGGFVGVSNVGRDTNWLGHHLAMANLYGFGRLAWNADLGSDKIADEWTRQTFGNDPKTIETIVNLQLQSWPAYEHYTGPLGAGTLTEIIGIHYGPGIESSEYNGWGQWHRANETGVGMDRSIATGTHYIAQYSPPIAKMYESLETCPDELLLFMHHVPYTHVLHSGKTVIQHIYDSHYQGVQEAEGFVRQWKTLKGKIDEQRYNEVLDRLEYQAGHAQVWRDAICQWFLKKSGIADTSGRAGHYQDRIEAEAMKLEGYGLIKITPWEDASGGQAIAVTSADRHGKASFKYSGKAGWFDLRVQYFDPNDGVARFKVFVGGQQVDSWSGDDALPSRSADSHTSKRRAIGGLALRLGDEITIEGMSDRTDRAAIDYVEIVPHED